MSQAKVNQYKKDKANRKKIMQREKAERLASQVCAWAILLAIVGWAGYSGYAYYESKKPKETIYADVTPITDYFDSLDTETE